mmetsp:Transcript_9805/g.12130  ORF Transcript_9805/g.12130 Transcript_9805/m.12130 type:complete len:260 (-) Transcript_9805:657-1436(-)
MIYPCLEEGTLIATLTVWATVSRALQRRRRASLLDRTRWVANHSAAVVTSHIMEASEAAPATEVTRIHRTTQAMVGKEVATDTVKITVDMDMVTAMVTEVAMGTQAPKEGAADATLARQRHKSETRPSHRTQPAIRLTTRAQPSSTFNRCRQVNKATPTLTLRLTTTPTMRTIMATSKPMELAWTNTMPSTHTMHRGQHSNTVLRVMKLATLEPTSNRAIATITASNITLTITMASSSSSQDSMVEVLWWPRLALLKPS